MISMAVVVAMLMGTSMRMGVTVCMGMLLRGAQNIFMRMAYPLRMSMLKYRRIGTCSNACLDDWKREPQTGGLQPACQKVAPKADDKQA